ncbi:prolipoprotein diacylglyceryl transferase [Flavobacteriales bacterium]|nr:prolipoprotein diacylglyceryl transferase [Flavobacteriales bacterium]
MYPTLYHFFKGAMGIEIEFLRIIPMLGFWIGIAFLAANFFGARELKRREGLGLIKTQKKTIIIGKPASALDLIINGVYGFIIGFKFIPLFLDSSIFSDFVGFLLSSKGNLVAGILVGIGMAVWKYWEANKEKLETPIEKEIDFRPHEHMGNVTLIGIVGGIGGALIFATLEKPWLITELISNPSLGFSHLYNGLTVYGGVILSVFGCVYYFWKQKLPISQYLDALGPTVLFAYGVGRIGCQLAGDGDWGEDNLAVQPDFLAFLPDWMWAYDYPNNINNEGIEIENSIFPDYNHKLENPVYPSPIYEMFMCFGLFAFIWSLRKKLTAPMMMFSIYILVTGLERILIESIRVNTKYPDGIFEGFTQAEVISVSLIILGILGIVFSYRQHRKKEASIVNQID